MERGSGIFTHFMIIASEMFKYPLPFRFLMKTDLIHMLKTCPKDERREMAIDFARRDGQGIFKELKNMVDGRRRRYLRAYSYDDQLAGIEALGVSGLTESLSFLSKIYSSVKGYDSGERICTWKAQGSGDLPTYESIGIFYFIFPWARKTLRSKLKYSIELNTSEIEGGWLVKRSEHEIKSELEGVFKRSPHSLIQGAIKQLKADTGKKAQIITIDVYVLCDDKKDRIRERYISNGPLCTFDESGFRNGRQYSPQEFMGGKLSINEKGFIEGARFQ
ncbi:hypothetical protein ACFL6I_13885 [candidate division KSB1 bacterium]